ncbi:hypothetical protein [Bradyrhizobium sp. 2S1]|uniref:hypothetical protein n=1 Tax=Bradyrhizobium sp. 2S1 TaxID=1404429 RepID=UPI003BB85279
MLREIGGGSLPLCPAAVAAQKLLKQLAGVGAKGFRDGDELDQVEPPFPALIFGDKGLRPAKLVGERVLADAGLVSHRDKKRDEALIFGRLEGLLHRRRGIGVRAAGNLILDSDYPKRGYFLTVSVDCSAGALDFSRPGSELVVAAIGFLRFA